MSITPATPIQTAAWRLQDHGVAEQIDAALLRGAVMLTPNLRVARAQMRIFDNARRAQGLQAWQPAHILPWRSWTSSLWREAIVQGVEDRVMLNPLQEEHVWRQALRADAQNTLRPISSLTQLCAAAGRLLGAYDVDHHFTAAAWQGSQDTDAFAGWYTLFEQLCATDRLLPGWAIDIELATHCNAHRLTAPGELLLLGFNTLLPSQRAVLAALQACGTAVQSIDATATATAAATLVPCADAESETATCANWIRSTLDHNPQTRITVVVPDLDTCGPALERALRAVVAPDADDVTAQPASPIELSTGRPLASLPMVADALTLLLACSTTITFPDAGRLLRSAHLTLAPTPELGAELDTTVLARAHALRKQGTLRELAMLVQSKDVATAQRLDQLSAQATPLTRPQHDWATWTDTARELLGTAGWPGPRALSSVEFQAIDRWEEALDSLATLDIFGDRVPFATFLDRLATVVADTTFSPENRGALVQVVPLAEAAGTTADALWMLHADQATWSTRRASHPLLPWDLQRALAMPGADAAQDEADARATAQAIASFAAQAYFSYAQQSATSKQRPSSLIAHLPVTPFPAPALMPAVTSLEVHQDDGVLPSLPARPVTGGYRVLQAQAQCGFRAFAENRLFSKGIDELDDGLSPIDRGLQVHAILASFWNQVGTQAELIQRASRMGPDGHSERDTLLRTCIDNELAATTNDPWQIAYTAVQAQRLFRLLVSWLDLEAKRTPFTVESHESVVSGHIGPLTLNLRIDRIDVVQQGDEHVRILIDYKTSARPISINQWLGDRPDEPQLPLYAAATGIENVQAMAIGSVVAGTGNVKLGGLAGSRDLLLNCVEVNFDEQIQTWHTTLTQLANAFAQGVAFVDPKDFPATCEYCGQRMLCRVNPTTSMQLIGADAEGKDV